MPWLSLIRFLRQSVGMTILVLLLVFLDQASKASLFETIGLGGDLPLWQNVLHLTPTLNHGAAFSWFASQPQLLFYAVSILVVGLTFWVLSIQQGVTLAHRMAWAMVLGGAWGNWLDRLNFGAVRDFINVAVIHYPVFNVADSFICIGVAAVLFPMIQALFQEARPLRVSTENLPEHRDHSSTSILSSSEV